VEIDYKELLDKGQQLSAETDAALEKKPDDKELEATRAFLVERHGWLLFLASG